MSSIKQKQFSKWDWKYRLYKHSPGITQLIFILTYSSTYQPDIPCQSFSVYRLWLKLSDSSFSKSCGEAASLTMHKESCLLYPQGLEGKKRKDKSTGIVLERDKDEKRQISCNKVNRTHTLKRKIEIIYLFGSRSSLRNMRWVILKRAIET